MALLSWWNLIFLLPAVAALLYVLLLATGVVAGDEGGFDSDVDGDVAAGEAHGIEYVSGHGGDPGEPPGGLWQVLSLFGIGRAPLSLVLVSFFLLWGLCGWIGNSLFSVVLSSPAAFIWPSLALALIGATILTRLLASGLGRIMPATETYAVTNRQLVGKRARVRHLVTEAGGTAQLYDAQGRLHEVPVRVLPGEAPISAQADVVLWRFDPALNTFLVTPEDLDTGIVSEPLLQSQQEVRRS